MLPTRQPGGGFRTISSTTSLGYGHQIYNLDFVAPTLVEAPPPVPALKALRVIPEGRVPRQVRWRGSEIDWWKRRASFDRCGVSSSGDCALGAALAPYRGCALYPSGLPAGASL
jgi:hypothetical protein